MPPDVAADGQVRVAPGAPVPGLMARLTVPDAVGTRFPAASSTATTGWVPNDWAAWAPVGLVVKTSCEASPELTVKLPLPVVNVPSTVPSLATPTS